MRLSGSRVARGCQEASDLETEEYATLRSAGERFHCNRLASRILEVFLPPAISKMYDFMVVITHPDRVWCLVFSSRWRNIKDE
jgi:hypothetical protein